jgi:hypothetical protein
MWYLALHSPSPYSRPSGFSTGGKNATVPQHLYYQRQPNKPEMRAISAVLPMAILLLSLWIKEERIKEFRDGHHRW